MTEAERLALIDCAMYDPTMRGAADGQSPLSLGDWAAKVQSWTAKDFTSAVDATHPGEPGDGRLGGMTLAQFQQVAASIAGDPVLSRFVIANVTPRAIMPVPRVEMLKQGPGHDATFIDPVTGKAIVAFQGTANAGIGWITGWAAMPV